MTDSPDAIDSSEVIDFKPDYADAYAGIWTAANTGFQQARPW